MGEAHRANATTNSVTATMTVRAAPTTNNGASKKWRVPIRPNRTMGKVATDIAIVRTVTCAQDAPLAACGAAYAVRRPKGIKSTPTTTWLRSIGGISCCADAGEAEWRINVAMCGVATR